MTNFIYIRILRSADHSVFCVQEGQKYYWDPQFHRKMAYSSGQQVKRSIMEQVLQELNERPSPVEFISSINKDGKLQNKQAISICDPQYTDQLLGGWMQATGQKQKAMDTSKTKDEDKEKADVLKRRSPFSISAMRPLHPLLGGLEAETENITFDRSSNPALHKVRVYHEGDKKVLTDEEIEEFLTEHNRTLPRRIWIPDHSRASGLYVVDIAIDLRTLFCVSTNLHEPELDKAKIEELKEAGWIESENVFGKCLICPEEKRKQIIDAIAKAMFDWRINSNQARTFSPLEILAVAISQNANQVTGAIRAQLNDKMERQAATPVIDESGDASVYVMPQAEARVEGAKGSLENLTKAQKKLRELLESFEYENQLG